MITITRTISIDERELREEFIRASGPGGQHVNKVATAVQLRFDAKHSPGLPPDVRERLMRIGAALVSADGEVVITAQRFRSQVRNREDARERLRELIRRAAQKPKVRHKTKPTAQAKQKRLLSKKRRGDTKKLRGKAPAE